MGKAGKTFGSISGALTGAGAIGGLLGGVGGGEVGKLAEGAFGGLTDLFDDTTDQTSTSTVRLRNFEDLIKGRSGLEADASQIQGDQLAALRDLLTQGGTAQAQGDITAARGAQLDLASMLQQAQRGPSSQNINDAQAFAQSIFAPQQQALQQQFQQAETETSRLAARLGRQVDDPILRAKLAEAQGQQMGQLQAQKGAFTAQNAMGFQQNALGFQQQLAGVRGGLATQALQNRQALMSMGQSLINQERNFRLNTATQTGNSRTVQQGGFGDVLGAGLGIAGTAASFMSDVRAKENFSEAKDVIRKTLDKLSVAEYNYKHDPQKNRKVSLMAQDLENAGLGDAVVEINGVKFVEYGKVSEFMAAAVVDMHNRVKALEEK